MLDLEINTEPMTLNIQVLPTESTEIGARIFPF